MEELKEFLIFIRDNYTDCEGRLEVEGNGVDLELNPVEFIVKDFLEKTSQK